MHINIDEYIKEEESEDGQVPYSCFSICEEMHVLYFLLSFHIFDIW